jgi:stress-induced morphogen
MTKIDFLIIRNKCDRATEYTNWIGEGMKEYLENKEYTVTDLSDANASPEKVREWLRYDKKKTRKAVIALDHGSTDAFWGEKNGQRAQVINLANCEELTKKLHVYTLACSTNAIGGLGDTAIKKGCLSWLGYTEPVYAAKSSLFKQCIWSYVEAMAKGKTVEECEQALRNAYRARRDHSFIYQYNLDRLLLRKSGNDVTINSSNRISRAKTLMLIMMDD